MISYRKIGGLRFLRVGRFQISWCLMRRRVTVAPEMALAAETWSINA